MSFVYPTVLISSLTYNVYCDTVDADNFLLAEISSQGTAWQTADPVTQARALISATRWLEAAQWTGSRSDPTNVLQFPRTGLVDAAGNPVDPTTLPVNLINACCALAAGLVYNPDLRDELQDPIAKDLRAGSTGLTFFRPIGGAYGAKDVQVLSFFPQNVMDLVGLWVEGMSMDVGPLIVGTDEEGYEVDFGLQHGL